MIDLNFIKSLEGLRLKAYRDSVGIWTIGYGNTHYPDGSKVKEGDEITLLTANMMLKNYVDIMRRKMKITRVLNNNQETALASFAYNIGTSGFNTSTVLKKVNANPNDPTIRDAFMLWNKPPEIIGRRSKEANKYFKL